MKWKGLTQFRGLNLLYVKLSCLIIELGNYFIVKENRAGRDKDLSTLRKVERNLTCMKAAAHLYNLEIALVLRKVQQNLTCRKAETPFDSQEGWDASWLTEKLRRTYIYLVNSQQKLSGTWLIGRLRHTYIASWIWKCKSFKEGRIKLDL